MKTVVNEKSDGELTFCLKLVEVSTNPLKLEHLISPNLLGKKSK